MAVDKLEAVALVVADVLVAHSVLVGQVVVAMTNATARQVMCKARCESAQRRHRPFVTGMMALAAPHEECTKAIYPRTVDRRSAQRRFTKVACAPPQASAIAGVKTCSRNPLTAAGCSWFPFAPMCCHK